MLHIYAAAEVALTLSQQVVQRPHSAGKLASMAHPSLKIVKNARTFAEGQLQSHCIK
jgi:hypothetical protein